MQLQLTRVSRNVLVHRLAQCIDTRNNSIDRNKSLDACITALREKIQAKNKIIFKLTNKKQPV